MKYVALSLVVGAIWAMQPIINAQLAKSIGTVGAAGFSFAVGWVFLACAFIFVQAQSGVSFHLALAFENPKLLLGGVIGAVVVLGMTYLVPRFGAGNTLALAITGQLIMAAAIDQFGLLGIPQVELSPFRILGFVLLLIGVNIVVHK
ncbi:hypothetical protein SRRS_35470 [Sporomusa rhizae]|uniref:DMT family transporter n=1 Tax=Sporomusa rhizae TaxID=357999 RepID=UPI00352A6E9A